MKRNKELLDRQNHEKAITLLRASEHCLNSERRIKYLMIFLSFSVCLAAIFNRYLPQMLPDVNNIADIQEKIATYINLISGVVLVCGIALGFYVERMHTEGTVLQDRYEAYVFNNEPNHSVLRPVSQAMVEVYAKKTNKKSDDKFRNHIYGPDDDPSVAAAQFEFISKEVRSDYKLYIFIQPFFLTLWIGFCIVIMIIAVSFNDKFITTLINILIPSLSAISTIASSWHGCRLQMRQLQNLINVIDGIQSMPESRKLLYITDKRNIRLLADGLFAYRASAFVIPKFLIKKFQKTDKTGYTSVGRHTDIIIDQTAAAKSAETDVLQQKNVKNTNARAGKTAQSKPVQTVKTTSKTEPNSRSGKSGMVSTGTAKNKTKVAPDKAANITVVSSRSKKQ